MDNELSGEVRALRTEVQALTQGLLLQQGMLRTMDEKLNCLLRAATVEDEQGGENALQTLLAEIVEGINALAEGQVEIVKLLRAPATVQ